MTKRKYDFNRLINRLILFICIGLVAHLCYLLYTTDRGTIMQLQKLNWEYLLLISLLALGPWIGHMLRIYIWARFVGFPLTMLECFTIVITNDIGAAVVPFIVGGGPVKYGMLVAKGMPPVKSTFLVLLSMTEDLVFYLVGFLLSFFFMRKTLISMGHALAGLKIPIFIILGVIVIVLVGRWSGIISNKMIKRFVSAKMYFRLSAFQTKTIQFFAGIKNAYVEVFKNGKVYLLMSLGLLFFQWFTKFTILAVILMALGIGFSYEDIYIRQWIIWVGMLIVPLPGASGGAEASFLLLFKNNMPDEIINLVVSTWRFFSYYYILFLCVILYQFLHKKTERELVVD